jgi:hypothetical protein
LAGLDAPVSDEAARVLSRLGRRLFGLKQLADFFFGSTADNSFLPKGLSKIGT